MTPKQEKFVLEYLIDLNATQASIRAGYSENRASEIGYQLLQKTTVLKAIQKAQKANAERNMITIDRITQMHLQAFDVAKEQLQAHAMTTTANNLAKLHGLITDKTKAGDEELEPVTSITYLTEDASVKH